MRSRGLGVSSKTIRRSRARVNKRWTPQPVKLTIRQSLISDHAFLDNGGFGWTRLVPCVRTRDVRDAITNESQSVADHVLRSSLAKLSVTSPSFTLPRPSRLP
jgi:hypothetical protein